MNSKKVTEFSELISHSETLEYLKSVSFKRATQIQADCIPELLANSSVSVQGKTGSGKTLGYLLPIIQMLKDLEKNSAGGQRDEVAAPKAIIVLPTRELALQVFAVTKSISHYVKLRIRKLVGGDKGKSLSTLFSTPMDVLITTPDRCMRAVNNGELKKGSLKFLVLDEADQLLEPSFKKTMESLVKSLDDNDLKVFLVSASRPTDFSSIVEEYFSDRTFITVGRGEENVLNHQVKTYNIALEEPDKFYYVKSFVKKQEKRNGLIFTGNKARARKVYEEMAETGHKKMFLLHKDLETKERAKVVEKFRNSGGILVATDIFARGIDINHLEWVLNFDLPSEPDYYLHRSGRVGRAGRAGDVFNFVTSKDSNRQKRINETLSTQGRQDLRINKLN